MNQMLAIILLAFLPACAALNCYICASATTGCNDPFSASATNVSTLSVTANIYCVKTRLPTGIVSRFGAPTCTNISFILGVGTACCQTDLCNGAQGTHQMPFLAALSFLIILFKLY